MFKHGHAAADQIESLGTNVGVNEFFAIGRSRGQDRAVRIENGRRSAKGDAAIGADAIGQNEIALVLHGTGEGQHAKMLDPHERPRRRRNKNVDAMFDRKFATDFGESQIVTNS